MMAELKIMCLFYDVVYQKYYDQNGIVYDSSTSPQLKNTQRWLNNLPTMGGIKLHDILFEIMAGSMSSYTNTTGALPTNSDGFFNE